MAGRANYDTIAWVYDILSRLIFGNAIKESQTAFMHLIPANASILIVGGGTGWVLEELAKRHSGLRITFLDASARMIGMAQKKDSGANQVSFINNYIEDAPLEKYDVVITPYIFDGFSQQAAQHIFEKLDSVLLPGGIWLYSDFQVANNQRIWQKPFINVMYLFFRITTNIQSDHLPDVETLFNKAYKPAGEKMFYHQFIISRAYIKAIGK